MQHPDKYQNKAARSKPLQARGKERVRLILAAALELFQERGVDDVTTNDIAQRAHIPIGSLYRYYPNKDSIIAALTEAYVGDVSRIFYTVGKHPMLAHLSWEEVLFLVVDGWVEYSRRQGPFDFLYAQRASPKLRDQNLHHWQRFLDAFARVLHKRCPELSPRHVIICFQLCVMAAELSTNEGYRQFGGEDMHHDAVSAAASYMLRVCGSTEHHTDGILG
jgi:AcrR family transcriptional regulator